MKDLLVLGIGWLSFINLKFTWYQSLNQEIELVLDSIKQNEAEEAKAAAEAEEAAAQAKAMEEASADTEDGADGGSEQ